MELEKMDIESKNETNLSNDKDISHIVDLTYTKEEKPYIKNNYFIGNVLCLWYNTDNKPRVVIGPHCKFIFNYV